MKAISRDEWDDGASELLESIRRVAEARLTRLNMLMKMHDTADALTGKSHRLDVVVRKLQSATLAMSWDRGTITDLLKELEALGY